MARVVLDAIGGDHAPSEVLRGLALALQRGFVRPGEVILVVMSFLFPYLLPLPFYGLEVFVAFIQALVFSILTMVFMLLATISHGGETYADFALVRGLYCPY